MFLKHIWKSYEETAESVLWFLVKIVPIEKKKKSADVFFGGGGWDGRKFSHFLFWEKIKYKEVIYESKI